ncbi:MAG: hypothetical protein K5888_02110 [Lachnospiraceae bacterium]|nr:hypothetical protein [Lachnospiraceae bacterium]
MKKKILLLILFIMIACTGLTACSKASDKASSEIEEEEDEDKAESKSKKKKKKNKDKDKDNDKDKEEDEKEYDDQEAKDAYLAMLTDEISFIVDADGIDGNIVNGKEYTLSEFVNSVISYEVDDEGWDLDSFRLTRAEYAFADCGNDGETEFLLSLNYGISGDFNYAYFFKYEDGVIKLKGEQYWPYRAMLDVNQCGYCIYSGAGGANIYITTAFYYDENCERVYLYDQEEIMMMSEPRVPKSYTKYEYDSDEYPDDEFDDDGCYIYFLRFKEYEYDDDYTHEDYYNEYYKDQIYHFEDDYGNDLEPSEEMQKIYKKDGIKWAGLEEFEKIKTDREKEMGLTPEIKDAPPAQWTDASETGVFKDLIVETGDDIEGYGTYDVEMQTIYDDKDKPFFADASTAPWEYRPIKIKEKSCKENEILDEDRWLKEVGMSPLGDYFSDSNYSYQLSGTTAHGNYLAVSVYDKSNNLLYAYDLSDFEYEDGWEGGEDSDYIDRGIKCAMLIDNYLYLSVFHDTYAASCPANGYIICIDVNTSEIIWISDPLVVNSRNFSRYGDSLITGYGFTDEKDYLCVINRFTGETVEQIKLKKKPYYITFKDDELWVRTYSYDYVFTIEE